MRYPLQEDTSSGIFSEMQSNLIELMTGNAPNLYNVHCIPIIICENPNLLAMFFFVTIIVFCNIEATVFNLENPH